MSATSRRHMSKRQRPFDFCRSRKTACRIEVPGCSIVESQLDMSHDLNPQVLGYSGGMDPYLLRSYRYNTSGTFEFKQLSIQSVNQGSIPLQFLLSRPGLFSQSRLETGLQEASLVVSSRELESIVAVDTDHRLIALYRKFVLPHVKLFKLIAEGLQYEAHNPSFALVQTLLLLVIRPSTNPLILESSLKWSFHGTLVASAQTLGLHHDPTTWAIASWQIALRCRILCTIFSVDKWLACSLGRPPLITQDSWLVTTLTDADNHTSSLSSLLYSLRAVNELSYRLLERLLQWHDETPSRSDDQIDAFESLLALSNIGYHYVQMTIFRAIVRPTLANISAVGVVKGLTSHHSDVERLVRKGVQSTIAGATAFVSSLRQDHVPMFWPQWSQVAFSCICFFNLLIATSSSDAEEAMSWFRNLHAARKELRLKSEMLPVLRLGLLTIDAFFWECVDKVLHLQPHVQQALETSMNGGLG
ncbi:hypothetical protein BKA63DRAFT_542578 [Paraphoma chrysanthemicola]|nr:hypothetical protein BKA63DRAFT_542578 [Paraphoma chrysanthemicola]